MRSKSLFRKAGPHLDAQQVGSCGGGTWQEGEEPRHHRTRPLVEAAFIVTVLREAGYMGAGSFSPRRFWGASPKRPVRQACLQGFGRSGVLQAYIHWYLRGVDEIPGAIEKLLTPLCSLLLDRETVVE